MKELVNMMHERASKCSKHWIGLGHGKIGAGYLMPGAPKASIHDDGSYSAPAGSFKAW